MKRLVVSGLSFMLALAATAPAIKATAAISPQVHTTAVSAHLTPVSPWLIRVNETRASKVAVVQSTTISTTAVSTQRVPTVSPWLVRVNQTRGLLDAAPTSAGHTAKVTTNSITPDGVAAFHQHSGR